MADWNPALYTRFEDERTRPAAELLARVPLEAPRLAIDLGCGPGNSTALIAARFPDAEVIGGREALGDLRCCPQMAAPSGDRQLTSRWAAAARRGPCVRATTVLLGVFQA